MVSPMARDALARIDRDPARSYTLPGRYYHDPEIYARELTAILYRSWLYAGHVCQLTGPADALVREIGERKVVVRRGGTGNFIGVEDAGDGQRPVRIEVFLGFVFFNFDPDAVPLSRQTGGMAHEFRSFCAAPEALRLAYRKTYHVAANWKTVMENYAECYHCPIGHPSLSRQALDMTNYRIAVHDAYHHHNCGDQGDRQGYRHEPGASPRGDEFGGWSVFPTVAFEFYPGGKLTVFHNRPVAPEHTVQTIEWYLEGDTPTEAEQEVIDFIDVVRREDFPLVENVQKGLRSRGYRQGRFIVDAERSYISEHAVHALQLKVLRALGEID